MAGAVPHAEIAAQFATLESWLGVQPGSFGLQSARERGHPLADLRWQDWSPRFSKWIPFNRRNVHRAFAPAFAGSPVRGYLNARAGDWRFRTENGRQRLELVTARSTNGHAVSVRARVFVICAGALESARCVLEMDEAAGPLSGGVRDLTGRFLADHLSLRLARVRIADLAGFKDLFAPVFVNGTLRSLRMELSPDYLSKMGLPAMYAHFVMETSANSGFSLLRDVFRGLQRGGLHQFALLAARIPAALPGLAEIGYERIFRRRLPIPRGADVFLQCDFEQPLLRENRLYLGAPGADGLRTLHVDWHPGNDAARIAAQVRHEFGLFWAGNGLDRIARLEPIGHAADGAIDPAKLYDIYHPSGTTRMSADPAAGVVDPNLLIHGTSNAYVAGSGVFPSMGAANPTFTAMALGLRLVAFADRQLRRA